MYVKAVLGIVLICPMKQKLSFILNFVICMSVQLVVNQNCVYKNSRWRQTKTLSEVVGSGIQGGPEFGCLSSLNVYPLF